MTSWSDRISYTRPHHDLRSTLIELLQQDGFTERDMTVPPIGSDEFLQLIKAAESFTTELCLGQDVCPVRAGRWLNRIAQTLTKKQFSELTLQGRRVIAHAALLLGGHPELLK